MATTSGKRQWLGHNLSVDLGQGDKRQATASGTCKKNARLEGRQDKAMASCGSGVAWPRLGKCGLKAGRHKHNKGRKL
jgi:hypothetical protein